MPYQETNGNFEPGQQRECPAMCARWDTVLKENGQLENTPVVMSPFVPGDTITQCPKQCDPQCCKPASQGFTQTDQSQALGGSLQDDQGHPPACMEGCPKACYPACRPGCCNGPRLMSMYEQNIAQQTPMMQPMSQPYFQQSNAQIQTTSNQVSSPYLSQSMDEPGKTRDIISYPGSQIPGQYTYSQYYTSSQTRATIPQPNTYIQESKSWQQRSHVPKSSSSSHAITCPIPCSPICAPHCTKHCCESYD